MKQTRITVDLQDPELLKLLKLEAAVERRPMREIVRKAIQGFFTNKKEYVALMKAAESTFLEWENARDADYDRF